MKLELEVNGAPCTADVSPWTRLLDVLRDVVTDARVAFGALAARPLRITAVEAAVRGRRLAEAAEAARTAMRAAIEAIDDVRVTASQREVAENLVARFFAGP